jgi:hypothetical protein
VWCGGGGDDGDGIGEETSGLFETGRINNGIWFPRVGSDLTQGLVTTLEDESEISQ